MSQISTVVHANELVDASYALALNELRLLMLAATKVDSTKKQQDAITISVEEFMAAYSITYSDIYANLRAAVKSIMRKPIRIHSREKNKSVELAWLVANEYDTGENGSHITMKFSPLIEPYLFELKERFTKLDFVHVSKLNTHFSFRLYQWLKKSEHLHSAKTGGAIKVVLPVKWMKEQSQLEGDYERWSNFRIRIIEPTIQKINAHTDISVSWRPLSKGRKVTDVEFVYINQKDQLPRPERPRLHRRPKVVKGSHEEGAWMRKNLKLLLDYEAALKAYDPKATLTLADLRRMAEYASICDRITHQRLKKEISNREKRKTAPVKETTYEDLGYDFDNE